MSLLKVAGTTATSGQLYVDSVFSTYLYTGNGSTQTITNGIDLAGKGGLVWIKQRTVPSGTGYHFLYDSARGYSSGASANGYAFLNSNRTAAEGTNSETVAYPFNSNGFSLLQDSGGWGPNQSGSLEVSWTFRKAAKFFDVVTYTGTGSARTIAHSLGVAPGMVIVKRTDASANWQVYSNGLTSAAYSIQLNLTNAQASAPTVWNSTAPTSSVFSVGTDASVNASGGTYVAYLFAHDTSSTGLIQCGSFTTSSYYATVNLGYEPQWILYKRTDSTVDGDWQIADNMRGLLATANSLFQGLQPNLSAAESSTGNIQLTSTGFVFGGALASPYIYMAIRRPNKPPTSGTQVFSPQIWTGNATARTITGTNNPVDLSIVTVRNNGGGGGGDRLWNDRLRGAYQTLYSNYTSAEATQSNYITGFDVQYGEKIGTALPVNGSSVTYVAEMFSRAPGFFDVVCFTASGSNFTVTHNLGAVPDLVITKCRSGANTAWNTYASPIGNTKNLVVNATSPAYTLNVWQNTTPTATSLFLTGGGDYFSMGETYVAYLFATLAGISKVGSYTGNGSTGQAIACGFSAGARFVLIKRTDSTGGWYTFDSARGLTSGSSPYLLLNSTAAEVTGNNGVYASTGGFTLGSTASTTTNINGASYIYLSVA